MLDRNPTDSLSQSSNPKASGLRKFLRNLILAATVIVYGDWLLHGILHLLHIPFGILELLVDHFYIEVMGLSHRGAEIATAYTVFTLAAFAAIRLLRMGLNAYRRAASSIKERCRQWGESPWLLGLVRYRSFVTAGLATLVAGYFFLL